MTCEGVGLDRTDKGLEEGMRIEEVETWVAWQVVSVIFYAP